MRRASIVIASVLALFVAHEAVAQWTGITSPIIQIGGVTQTNAKAINFASATNSGGTITPASSSGIPDGGVGPQHVRAGETYNINATSATAANSAVLSDDTSSINGVLVSPTPPNAGEVLIASDPTDAGVQTYAPGTPAVATSANGLQSHPVLDAPPADGNVLLYQTDTWVPYAIPMLKKATITVCHAAMDMGTCDCRLTAASTDQVCDFPASVPMYARPMLVNADVLVAFQGGGTAAVTAGITFPSQGQLPFADVDLKSSAQPYSYAPSKTGPYRATASRTPKLAIHATGANVNAITSGVATVELVYLVNLP